MTVPQPLLITFPEKAAPLDVNLVEQSFAALYGKVMVGAKVNDKQRTGDVV